MKVLLPSFTEATKTKGEQLPSPTLSEEDKNAESSERSSFTGFMIGFLGMGKKSIAAARGNSPLQAEEALAKSVTMKTDVAVDKNEVNTRLIDASLEINARKKIDINTEAGKAVSAQNQVRTSEKANKLIPQPDAAAVKKVNDLAGKKVLAPEKENVPTPSKVAEGIINNNEQGHASIKFKDTKIEKERVLRQNEDAGATVKENKKSISSNKFKGTVSEYQRVGNKVVITEQAAGKKDQSLKKSASIPDISSRQKGNKIEDGLKPLLNKDNQRAVKKKVRPENISRINEQSILKTAAKDQLSASKVSIVKQGQAAKAFSPSPIQENTLFRHVEQDMRSKMNYKEGVKLTSAGEKGKRSATNFSENSSSKLDGNMKEKLMKQMHEKPAPKKDSRAPLYMRRSPESSGGSSQKTASSISKPLNGKLFSAQTSAGAQKDTHIGNMQDVTASGKNMKEVEIHNLKAIQLADSGGRSKFGKYLAQVTRQQVSSQARPSRQPFEWKHHRFILKDGNAVNIAARTSSGALQLQMSAGNGELGKIIQQHLHDIQQHVQQELDIEIDLQLKDFGKQQTDQQHDSVSEKNTSDGTDANDRNSANNLTEQTEGRQIRYFGFNKNEWVA